MKAMINIGHQEFLFDSHEDAFRAIEALSKGVDVDRTYARNEKGERVFLREDREIECVLLPSAQIVTRDEYKEILEKDHEKKQQENNK